MAHTERGHYTLRAIEKDNKCFYPFPSHINFTDLRILGGKRIKGYVCDI